MFLSNKLKKRHKAKTLSIELDHLVCSLGVTVTAILNSFKVSKVQ